MLTWLFTLVTFQLVFLRMNMMAVFCGCGGGQLDFDSGSRLMPVGSPLDTHDCDWCMLRCHARGINTTRITAAFTFDDLLLHLPNLPWITITNIAFRVPCTHLLPTGILNCEEDETLKSKKKNALHAFKDGERQSPSIFLWWMITICYLINVGK